MRGKWPLVAVASCECAEGEKQCFQAVGSPFFRNRRADRVRIGEHTSHPHPSHPQSARAFQELGPKSCRLGVPIHYILLSQGGEWGIDGIPVGISQSL